MTSSIVFVVLNGVLSSAKNRSNSKKVGLRINPRIGPRKDPRIVSCGTTNKLSSQGLYRKFTFAACLLFAYQPYCCNVKFMRDVLQAEACEKAVQCLRSVNNAPNDFPLPEADFYFTSITVIVLYFYLCKIHTDIFTRIHP